MRLSRGFRDTKTVQIDSSTCTVIIQIFNDKSNHFKFWVRQSRLDTNRVHGFIAVLGDSIIHKS